MNNHEVLILGAGPAGLSAAMSLGRMGRSVLVCDDNRPRNAAAEHMNNFVSHDGLSPSEWRNGARQDLAKYESVRFYTGSVENIEKMQIGFSASFDDGAHGSFQKVILAHGVRDVLPAIKGINELWGKAVYHCPYCHGFEVRGTRLGLVASGPVAEHMLPMILSLSRDCVLFTQGLGELNEEFLSRTRVLGINIVESKIIGLEFQGEQLEAVELGSGERIARDGVFWAPQLPYTLKSDLGIKLGCERTEMGLYKVNDFLKTSVEGVFAAGDAAKGMHSVVQAMSSGQLAGAAAASEILQERFKSL